MEYIMAKLCIYIFSALIVTWCMDAVNINLIFKNDKIDLRADLEYIKIMAKKVKAKKLIKNNIYAFGFSSFCAWRQYSAGAVYFNLCPIKKLRTD